MKFETVAGEFQKALEVVEGIIPARTPLPAATHVRLELKDGTLTLTGTDASNRVQYAFPATGEDGVSLVPARKLLGFAKSLPGRLLHAESTAGRLTLTTENIELVLPELPPADFPNVPSPCGPSFTVEAGQLNAALRRTVFATAVGDERHVLCGCFLHFQDGKGCVVATDSRRLAWAQFCPVNASLPPDLQCIIPTAIAKLLMAHLTGADLVTCTVGERQVGFECETAARHYGLVFTQIEGKYPDYHRFIRPLQRENRIPREPLLQALKRASMAVEEKEGAVDLHFESRRLRIQSQHTCTFHESLEMDYQGEACVTVFSPRYIAEALEVNSDPEIKFDLLGPQSPLVFQGQNYMYLTMPRRLA